MKTSQLYIISTVLLLSILILTGCQSVYYTYSGPPDITASTASSININQKIPLNPGTTRIFIQDGRLVDSINHYKPNCNIEIRKRNDNNWQYVDASQFKITGSQYTEEEIVKRQYFKPQMLAFNNTPSNSNLLLANTFDDSGSSDIYLGIHYYLSGNDKNVMRLSCRGALDAPDKAQYPTREEIIKTLGDVVTVKL
ncbi:MAG: hypothetical protein HKP55_09545 [Gammaproteobacteria bacterium]|nr:hypothetical protein [Gammaproteobacteria bacterium]